MNYMFGQNNSGPIACWKITCPISWSI